MATATAIEMPEAKAGGAPAANDASSLNKVVPVEVKWDHITVRPKVVRAGARNTLLDGVSGCVRPGTLTAILGGSGSGKTTLLNAIAGLTPSSLDVDAASMVTINGETRDGASLRRFLAYVHQNDSLMATLTAREALQFAAELRLNTSPEVRTARVNTVLNDLGLSSVADVLTGSPDRQGGLSGGQRKRLGIALELLLAPSVLLLDEPTSGLDAPSAFSLIKLLKKLAGQGHTIVTVIHQPSSSLFGLFDRAIVMDKGSILYGGRTSDMVRYLAELGHLCPQFSNPADFVLDLTFTLKPEQRAALVDAYRANGGRAGGTPAAGPRTPAIADVGASSRQSSPRVAPADRSNTDAETKEAGTSGASAKDVAVVEVGHRDAPGTASAPAPPLNRGDSDYETPAPLPPDPDLFATSSMHQLKVLTRRTLLTMLRDKLLLRVRFGSHIGYAVLMGLLYLDVTNNQKGVNDRTGLVFFTSFFGVMASILPTVLSFPLERPVIEKEARNNWYSIGAYATARGLADIPFVVVPVFLFATLLVFMTGIIDTTESYLLFTLAVVVTAITGQGWGLLVGCLAPSLPVAVFVAPLSTIPMMLLSGFMVNLQSIGAVWDAIGYAAFFRYSFSSTMIAMFREAVFKCDPDEGVTVPNPGGSGLPVKLCPIQKGTQVLQSLALGETLDEYWLDLLILVCFYAALRMLSAFVLKRHISG